MTAQEIKDTLASGEVKFSYEKVDGSIREARGTRNLQILEEYAATPKGNKQENDNIIPYFDLDVNGWRCFKVDSFLGFSE